MKTTQNYQNTIKLYPQRVRCPEWPWDRSLYPVHKHRWHVCTTEVYYAQIGKNRPFVTCGAVVPSSVLRMAYSWVPNMETWKLQHLTAPKPLNFLRWNFARLITSVRRTLPSLVGIHPLGVAPHIREIYTSCDLSSFLPSCLCFLRTRTGQTDVDNFTNYGPKDAVWRKEVTSKQGFSINWHLFWGSFYPKTFKISPPVGIS